MSFVYHRFVLNRHTQNYIRSLKPNFGYNGLGEIVFYRTYSRLKNDGKSQENWADCVIRVINGVFSIRKDYYVKNHLSWHESEWQVYASKMAISMFNMEWLPPGRGCWAMGSEYVYERGSMALQNCFSKQTKFITSIGTREFGEIVPGSMVEVLCADGKYREAEVKNFGKQRLYQLFFASLFNDPRFNNFYRIIVEVTRDHCWLLKDGTKTTNIQLGDIIPINQEIKLTHKDNYVTGYQLQSIIDEGKEEDVYCVVEPVTHTFTLQYGLITGNCGFINITDNLAEDCCWVMDALMCGVGIGFRPTRNPNFRLYMPRGIYDFIIEDTRESWVDSVKVLINSFLLPNKKEPRFDYSNIRAAGSLIKGFGGICSGYESLKVLHDRIRRFCIRYVSDQKFNNENYDSLILKTDIDNCIGCMAVSGNVRRSAELCLGKITDKKFLDLKNKNVYPERNEWAWMSNNSVGLYEDSDFELLGELAERLIINGEPNYVNLRNFREARIGKRDFENYKLREDEADGINPCCSWETYIHTTHGPKQIKSLSKLGPVKIITNGEIKDSTYQGAFSTGEQKLFRVETEDGHSIRVTAEHKLKIMDYGKQIWIKVSDLNIGDNLVLSNHNSINYHWIGNGTFEEGYLIGLVFNYSDIFDKENIDINKTLIPSIVRYYGIVFDGKTENLIVINNDDESTNCRLIINHDLIDLFLRYNLHKINTTAIEETSCEFHKGFLRGFFDQNCVIKNRRTIRVESIYNKIKAIQRMLLRLSINSKIIFKMRRGDKDVYPLKIMYDNVDRFSKTVWLNDLTKQALLSLILNLSNKITEKFTTKIRYIRSDQTEKVYDLTIPDGNQYCANGIVSHNCSEQTLEDKELCTLVETAPTRCTTVEDWYKACEYATFYASTATLLPTHVPETNKVMFKNRRIGVSIMDFIGWKAKYGVNKVTKFLRKGYDIVRYYNKIFNHAAGIPISIRVTTMKPGGSIPKLPGCRSGLAHASFHYLIRRIRVQQHSPISEILIRAGYPHEPDAVSANTEVFEIPLYTGEEKTSDEVSMWEQAFNVILLQREWSDNAVSATVLFDPNTKVQDIESLLSSIAPITKTMTLCPHTKKGVYAQMPEEGITKEEYEKRMETINQIDWSRFGGSDGIDERYCEGPSCEVKP